MKTSEILFRIFCGLLSIPFFGASFAIALIVIGSFLSDGYYNSHLPFMLLGAFLLLIPALGLLMRALGLFKLEEGQPIKINDSVRYARPAVGTLFIAISAAAFVSAAASIWNFSQISNAKHAQMRVTSVKSNSEFGRTDGYFYRYDIAVEVKSNVGKPIEQKIQQFTFRDIIHKGDVLDFIQKDGTYSLTAADKETDIEVAIGCIFIALISLFSGLRIIGSLRYVVGNVAS